MPVPSPRSYAGVVRGGGEAEALRQHPPSPPPEAVAAPPAPEQSAAPPRPGGGALDGDEAAEDAEIAAFVRRVGERHAEVGRRTLALYLPNFLLEATPYAASQRIAMTQALLAGVAVSWGAVESVYTRAIPCRRLDAYVPGSKRARDEAPASGDGVSPMVFAYLAFTSESAAEGALGRLAQTVDALGWLRAQWPNGEAAVPRGGGKGGKGKGKVRICYATRLEYKGWWGRLTLQLLFPH